MTLKSIFLSAITLTTLGLGTAAARADGYVVSRSGPSYSCAPAPVYVFYPPAYVAAQGYYSYTPSPVYAAPTPVYVPSYSYGPVYRPPVCEPPVVIYRPPVECREPVRIFRPYDRDRRW